MGRSTKEQADTNHRSIVAAAGNLFRSRGYDAVGIADVMKAAGMTQGGFYKHFASKEALAAEAWAEGFGLSAALWKRKEKNSPSADIIDYYLASKPPEHRCPMVAHGEESARMEDGCELRGVYAEGAKALFDTFMDAAKASSMEKDRAQLLFAAMVGANMLGRATDDADWVAALRKTVKAAARE
jgi:TetR/AcrR family transcriptional regulator, transcriptional repressor for nem operon